MARTANPNNICYEVVIVEPPIAGQLETTVEQTGAWKDKDRYVVERQIAYGEAIARILGGGSFLGRTIQNQQGVEQAVCDISKG